MRQGRCSAWLLLLLMPPRPCVEMQAGMQAVAGQAVPMGAGCTPGPLQWPCSSQGATCLNTGKSHGFKGRNPLDCPVLPAGCSSHLMAGRETLASFLSPILRHTHTDWLRSHARSSLALGRGPGAAPEAHGRAHRQLLTLSGAGISSSDSSL